MFNFSKLPQANGKRSLDAKASGASKRFKSYSPQADQKISVTGLFKITKMEGTFKAFSGETIRMSMGASSSQWFAENEKGGVYQFDGSVKEPTHDWQRKNGWSHMAYISGEVEDTLLVQDTETSIDLLSKFKTNNSFKNMEKVLEVYDALDKSVISVSDLVFGKKSEKDPFFELPNEEHKYTLAWLKTSAGLVEFHDYSKMIQSLIENSNPNIAAIHAFAHAVTFRVQPEENKMWLTASGTNSRLIETDWDLNANLGDKE